MECDKIVLEEGLGVGWGKINLCGRGMVFCYGGGLITVL